MIKVLIVDDEPKLREGLRTLIPWEKHGFTVVATAANGLQALEKYHTYYPELMVVDIRMPGMDGLELIGELRKEGSGCHVLILSGHADFDYAKKAIVHRVDGYLLKPVDEDEMISYLEQLREAIAQEDRYSRWYEDEPARNREAMLRSLLVPAEGESDLKKYTSALGLDSGSCEVVLIELLETGNATEEQTAGIRAILEQHFLKKETGFFFNIPPYMGGLLKRPLLQESDRLELYGELAALLIKENYKFNVAAGGAVSQAEASFVSYTAAQELLNRAFFFRKNTIISPDSTPLSDLRKDVIEQPKEVSENAETRLLLAVETGSTAVIETLVKEKVQELMAENSDEGRIKETFVRLLSTVLARLEPAYPEIRSYAADHTPPIGELYHSYYLSDLQEQAIAFLEEIAGQMNIGGRGNEIKKITELIQRRYNENLKLETLSELFNYNSAYLGKMFKSTTGEYFNTYVDKVRIEKAKQFLTQGMKVYEVAEKVGYMNPDYFNAKFRKYVGVSPTSYRKST
ncbi:response regulator transcription factor [Paenibacillus wynnii]|uniref:Chemotaxis protein CheY n=1 Tax=Paenibacillus wynnii TaxID=268407 RepID=A0A098MG18_9BACL|nr:response regulator transcription factor [Paenibacillus wynnii]KGE20988.1 hypothetical protein PWYN_02170 [Paenibacillus wynnii]